MRGERKDVARGELYPGVIRYSRIEPSSPADNRVEQDAEIFVGERVAGGVGSTDRAEPLKRSVGGRVWTLALFVIGIGAFSAGVAMIAGPSFFVANDGAANKSVARSEDQVSVTVAFMPESGIAQKLTPRSAPIVAVLPANSRPAMPTATVIPDMPDVIEPAAELPTRVATAEDIDPPAAAAGPQSLKTRPMTPKATSATLPSTPMPTDDFVRPSAPTLVAAIEIAPSEAAAVGPFAQTPTKPSSRVAQKLARKAIAALPVKETAIAMAAPVNEATATSHRIAAPTNGLTAATPLQLGLTKAAEQKPVFNSATRLDSDPAETRPAMAAVARADIDDSGAIEPKTAAVVEPTDKHSTPEDVGETRPGLYPAAVRDIRGPTAAEAVLAIVAAGAIQSDIQAMPTPRNDLALAPLESVVASAVPSSAPRVGQRLNRKAIVARPVKGTVVAKAVSRSQPSAPTPAVLAVADRPRQAQSVKLAIETAEERKPVFQAVPELAHRPVEARPLTSVAAVIVETGSEPVASQEVAALEYADRSRAPTLEAKSTDTGAVTDAVVDLTPALVASPVIAAAVIRSTDQAKPNPLPRDIALAHNESAFARAVESRLAQPVKQKVVRKPTPAIQTVYVAAKPTKAGPPSLAMAYVATVAAPSLEVAETRTTAIEAIEVALLPRDALKIDRAPTPALSVATNGTDAIAPRVAAGPSREDRGSVALIVEDGAAIPPSPGKLASIPAQSADEAGQTTSAELPPPVDIRPAVAAQAPAILDSETTSSTQKVVVVPIPRARPVIAVVRETAKPMAPKKQALPQPTSTPTDAERPAGETSEKVEKTEKPKQSPRLSNQRGPTGWRVLAVRGGIAIIDAGERGVFKVQSGTRIPGVGTIHMIKRDGGWSVVTSGGQVGSAY